MLFTDQGDWRARMEIIVSTMREMSGQTDPSSMVRNYVARMRTLLPTDATVAVSRRNVEAPGYRVTRSSRWKEEVNPWKDHHRMPVIRGGVLGELLYGDKPAIIDDFQVPRDDPAFEHLEGCRSLLATPLFDQGVALNMVVLMRREPNAFRREQFPEIVWMSNLFGRATYTLVLHDELREANDRLKVAYKAVDHEMQVVADIQKSLLPAKLPEIPSLDLAVHYQTSQRAGGDYYDFFPLPDGKWGILIADVSGHGTPAAVFMAVTHSIAHALPGPATPPGKLLAYVNGHLCKHYTRDSGTFVTAFYGIYDPQTRQLEYSCAGHDRPRLKRCSTGEVSFLNGPAGVPLGIWEGERFPDTVQTLVSGDQLVFYTDGITEARNPAGELFGPDRLDAAVAECSFGADDLLQSLLKTIAAFTDGRPPDDDRTLLTAKVR